MAINSISSDVKFPDMNFYNMSNPGEMALYLAHCDFYPFQSVLRNNQLALDALSQGYIETLQKAQANDDFYTESFAMTSGTLHNSRVSLLTYYSLVLTMVSILEESVNTLCRVYYNMLTLDKQLSETKGRGLERAAEYLKKEVGIEEFTSDPQWEYITTIRDARNMIVHNGGRVIKDFDKFDKFKIGYREEDHQLYFEYSDIEKMYNAILEYIDRAFRLVPTKK